MKNENDPKLHELSHGTIYSDLKNEYSRRKVETKLKKNMSFTRKINISKESQQTFSVLLLKSNKTPVSNPKQ